MKTLQEIAKLIDHSADIQEAGTGTIYITFANGKRVRVADHEPNFGAPRSIDYLEVYTNDACNSEISLSSNIERILAYLEIEANDEVSNILSGEYEKEAALINLKLANAKQVDAIHESYQQQLSDDLSAIAFALTKEEITSILKEAEAYSDLGSNGDKRRKRRTSFLRAELTKRGLPIVSSADLITLVANERN